MAGAIAALSVALVAAGQASAAPGELWSMSPTVITAYADQSNTFTFTATNLTVPLPLDPSPPVIGCVRVNVPNSVHIDSAAIVSPTGGSWSMNKKGGGVDVQAANASARLGFGESVRFSMTITPDNVGTLMLGAWAFEQTNCSAPQFGGSTNVVATILPPPLPTPIPTLPPLPTPLPTVPPLPTASPTPAGTARPTATPTGTASATPTGSPNGSRPSPSPSPTATPDRESIPPANSATPAAGTGLTIGSGRRPDSGDELAIDIGTGLGLDGIEWSVPAVAVGTPGIALILWVGIQAASGAIWLPWVRRLRRARERRRLPEPRPARP